MISETLLGAHELTTTIERPSHINPTIDSLSLTSNHLKYLSGMRISILNLTTF